MVLIRIFSILMLSLLAALPARALETRASSAWVYDLTSGVVLFDKAADQSLPPASMSKLMTVNMLFEALRDGRLDMSTQLRVSPRAEAMGGSTMFLDRRDRPTVEQLIQGIIVQSGNDACVVVAEGIAGTENAFAQMMNQRAQALGMRNSHFANASGWPNPEHVMSTHDLGILATRLITEFPEFYHFFSQERFEFDGRAPQNSRNRNPLLGLGIGADGLKTGHTQEAGYGLVGSAVQGDRRIVFVITGLSSAEDRAQEAERVVNWAFRQFVQRKVVTAGQRVAAAEVFLGKADSVDLVAAEDVNLLVPALQQDGIAGKAIYTTPLRAPVTAGTEVGRLVISLDGLPDHSVPLVTAANVAEGGFRMRLSAAASVILSRISAE